MPIHYHHHHYYLRYHRRPRPVRDYRRMIMIPTPLSTPDCIVFPYDKRNKKFKTNDLLAMPPLVSITLPEIEQFLEQINIPLKKWYEDYEYLYESSFKMLFCLIASFVILPLALVYFCWLSYAQSKSMKEMHKVAEQIMTFIHENSSQFTERGIMWHVPELFPQWIELRTRIEQPPQNSGEKGAHLPFAVLPAQPRSTYVGLGRNKIETTTMLQRNYDHIGIVVPSNPKKTKKVTPIKNNPAPPIQQHNYQNVSQTPYYGPNMYALGPQGDYNKQFY